MSAKAVRVVIAEDHALVRAGFLRLLEGVDGFEAVAEAATGREALRALREHRPDLLILDLSMPEMNGMEVIHRARQEGSDLRILVLSMHADREYVLRAFEAGADGYLVKAAGEAEFGLAVTSVARGERYVSPRVASHVLESTEGPAGGPFETLTKRQREVLQLLSEGCTTAEIANKLFISPKTVETHRADIQDRLGIDDLAGLVRYAMRHGMTSSER